MLFAKLSAFYLLQIALVSQAAFRPPHEEPPPDLPVIPKGPSIVNQPKPTVTGAIGIGANPHPNKVEGINIEEIGEKLLDFLQDVFDAIKDIITSTTTDSSGSSTVTTITTASWPRGATDCFGAWTAYDICSSRYTSFASSTPIFQAGCLCNAYYGYDFNSYMLDCYSFISGYSSATAVRGNASAVASATALCQTTSTCTFPSTVEFWEQPGMSCPPTATPTQTPESSAITTYATGGTKAISNANDVRYVLPLMFVAGLMPVLL